MKSALLWLVLALAAFPIGARADSLSRVERLVWQDTLMTLWGQGVTSISESAPPANAAYLAAGFLVLSEGSACGMERNTSPEAFADIPENYVALIPLATMDRALFALFGIDSPRAGAFAGAMLNEQGYYLDFEALSEKTGNLFNTKSSMYLPGYVQLEHTDASVPGECHLSGRLCRFKEVANEASPLLWAQATFTLILVREKESWRIKSLKLEEQAMG